MQEFSALSVMLKEQHSRKFSFSEIRRKLGVSRGSLDKAIQMELNLLLRNHTIDCVPNTVLGPLYYITGSKQDPHYKE